MSERRMLKQITALQSASLAELRARWRELHDAEPPARISRDRLVKRLVYRIQAQAFGGLSNRTRQQLAALAPGNGTGTGAPREGNATFGGARTGAGHGPSGAAGDGRVPRKPRSSRTAGAIVPGTVLVREWRGRRYEVTALDGGAFEFEGCRYRSLSAVAQAITSTHWNGPVFFGLRKRTRHTTGDRESKAGDHQPRAGRKRGRTP